MGGRQRAQQVLGVEHAHDILGLVAPQGQARVGGGQHRAHDLGGRQARIDGAHARAVDHHILHRQFVEPQQAAEHVAMAALDAALLVQQIDGAAQLLLRGQHGAMLARTQTDEPQHPAHDSVDGDHDRRHGVDEDRGGARHDQRHAVGEIDADGLG